MSSGMKITDETKDSPLNSIELNKGIKDYRYYSGLRKRKHRNIAVLLAMITGAITSLFLLLIPNNLTSFPSQDLLRIILDSNLVITIIGVFSLVFIANFLSSYLQVDNNDLTQSKKDGNSIRIALSKYEKQLSNLQNKYDRIVANIQSGSVTGDIFTPDEKDDVIHRIKDKLESETSEAFLHKLECKIRESYRFKRTEELCNATTSRLELEIRNQTQRGNLNLLLGILTTLVGVAILGYSVFQAPQMTTSIEIIAHFLPRLSLVVMIEIFAYFFLRLYRQSLEEIKYFQNEMTNIESKHLALYIATENAANEGVLSTITHLMTTERNFILKKGQSTTQIELRRIDSLGAGKLTEQLSAAIPSIINPKR